MVIGSRTGLRLLVVGSKTGFRLLVIGLYWVWVGTEFTFVLKPIT